jgi:nitroreductase
MEILQAIRQRRSVRNFQPKPIPLEALDPLIDALRWAPSAGNLESRRFYLVFNEELRAKLARAALGQGFIAQAPVAIVACADQRIIRHYGERGAHLYCLLDVAASLENLLLAAMAHGLASCWVGAFDEEEVRRLLQLPAHLRPVALVPVGFAAEHPEPPPRRPREETVVCIR